MSSLELSEWMEYDKLEPIGPVRDDLRIAMLGMRLAQAMGVQDAKLEQFLLSFDDEEIVGARDNALEDKAALLTRLFGGMDMRASNR